MKKFIYLAVFVVVLTLSNGQTPPEPAPTEAPTTAIPTKPTTIPTTTKPTTTTPVPTDAPTPKPTPKTTTTSTTTTTTTTTTPIPTTVTPATTTTSKPTPKPVPEVHTWSVPYADDSNKTCIVMKMALHLEIPYETVDNKTSNASICLPPTAVAHGECGNGNTSQEITIVWNVSAGINDSIKFVFDKNDTSKQFMITSITAKITPESVNFPNMKGNETITADLHKQQFITPMSMSYRCKKETTLNLDVEDGKNSTALFIVKDLQLEAFHKATGENFSTAEDCESSGTSGIVPIAVGCSLAALIIIVLIAYLVGRRRSQARGYLSM